VELQLTTVRTAPGFCTLRAFTTWNTSTTPSVLHHSINGGGYGTEHATATHHVTAGNIPPHSYTTHTLLTPMTGPQAHSLPAVYHNGLVACPPLDSGHFLNRPSNSTRVEAVTVKSPIGDVELVHLLGTARLWKRTTH